MPLGWAIGGAAVLGYLGSENQASAAQSAAQTQVEGTRYAADIQKQMFDTLNAQQAPYRAAGQVGLNKIQEMLPFFTKMPTAADIQGMPGYQFGLEQGIGATRQGMNVLSPGSNAERAASKFATDYTLTKALPAYLAQRSDIYNTLASIAGIGQKATGQSAELGMGTAGNLAQLATGGASAAAAGQIGAANAMASGLGGIGNALTLSQLLQPQTPAGMVNVPGEGNMSIAQYFRT